MSNDTKITPEKIQAMYDEIKKFYAEQEAKKTPEQRAAEKLQSETFAKNVALQENAKIAGLFKEWLKRDTWAIYDEAMPLTIGQAPGAATLFDSKDRGLWELVQSCAGHSLKVISQTANAKAWRVTPFEWVRWLKEKQQQTHPLLIELTYPKNDVSPTHKTAKATNSREIMKRQRISAIKAFAVQVAELARKKNIPWDQEAIPVTKGDFLQVLGSQNPDFKKISMASFDRDIAEIGLKFQRGTKSNKNNILKSIISSK